MINTYQDLLNIITLHNHIQPRELTLSEKQLVSKIIKCDINEIEEYACEIVLESPGYICIGNEESISYITNKETNETYYVEMDNYPETLVTPISL